MQRIKEIRKNSHESQTASPCSEPRFIDVQDQFELVHHLDGIWIGAHILSVKVARSREYTVNLAHERRQEPLHRRLSSTRIIMGLSFAEVVRGEKTLSHSKVQLNQTVPQLLSRKVQLNQLVPQPFCSKELQSNTVVIHHDVTESEWLKECLVGECFFVEQVAVL
ncbi:hypothetical protein Ancab_010163 [Ancistrocladus abbreviatus]